MVLGLVAAIGLGVPEPLIAGIGMEAENPPFVVTLAAGVYWEAAVTLAGAGICPLISC